MTPSQVISQAIVHIVSLTRKSHSLSQMIQLTPAAHPLGKKFLLPRVTLPVPKRMEAPRVGSPDEELLSGSPEDPAMRGSTWLGSLADGFDSIARPLKTSVDSFTRSVSESFAQSPFTSPTRETSLPDEGAHNIASQSMKSDLKGPGYAPIGFSFSPAGLLMPYHLGVVEYLEHTGWLTPNVPIGGASAGAIVVVCTALRIGTTRLMPHLYAMEADLR